ncbi:MAG: heme o synthase [Phycisphaerales bacterium]|nr:heme o synthase [Phycisphaerales bacterium]
MSTTPNIAPDTGLHVPADASSGRRRSVISDLTKARLTALVMLTILVGYILGRTGNTEGFGWAILGWTMLGASFAATGSAILNQVVEFRRDARMNRTRYRPIPTGKVTRAAGFAAGVLCCFAGTALLAQMVNLYAAGLTLFTVLIYILVYTPLKPLTTLNTLVGAVSGAVPPMIGWAAATDGLEAGAWMIGGLLFIWQLPHFLALAWMYKDDYERGGHAMLPVKDHDGNLTAQMMLMSALLLVPVGLSATLLGVSGWFSALGSLVLGIWFGWKCLGFWKTRSRENARGAFFASLLYLPLMLGVMVLDRGPVNPEAWLRGGREVWSETPASMILPTSPSLRSSGS